MEDSSLGLTCTPTSQDSEHSDLAAKCTCRVTQSQRHSSIQDTMRSMGGLGSAKHTHTEAEPTAAITTRPIPERERFEWPQRPAGGQTQCMSACCECVEGSEAVRLKRKSGLCAFCCGLLCLKWDNEKGACCCVVSGIAKNTGRANPSPTNSFKRSASSTSRNCHA